ncbi:hypothetical protein N7528_009449 [Penicillium herquei]|nr:hypothetical protein N7528_009449 [Penicillium herquei]
MDMTYPSYPDLSGPSWYFPVPVQTYNPYLWQPEYETGYQPFEGQVYQGGRLTGSLEALDARDMDNHPFQEYPGIIQQIHLPVHHSVYQARLQDPASLERQRLAGRRAQATAHALTERRRAQHEQERRERTREDTSQTERRNAAVERLAAREHERARRSRHAAAQRPESRVVAEHSARVEAARRREQARREQVQYLRNIQHLGSSSHRGIEETRLDPRQLVTAFEEVMYNMGEYAHGYRNYQAPPTLPSPSPLPAMPVDSEVDESDIICLTESSPERGRSPTPRRLHFH